MCAGGHTAQSVHKHYTVVILVVLLLWVCVSAYLKLFTVFFAASHKTIDVDFVSELPPEMKSDLNVGVC